MEENNLLAGKVAFYDVWRVRSLLYAVMLALRDGEFTRDDAVPALEKICMLLGDLERLN
jgi:hypothetical protein